MNNSRNLGFVPLFVMLIAVLATTAVSGVGYGVYKYQQTAKENKVLRKEVEAQKDEQILQLKEQLETVKTQSGVEQAITTEETTKIDTQDAEKERQAKEEAVRAAAKRKADEEARVAAQKATLEATQKANEEAAQRAAQETARFETQRLADEVARAEAQRIAEEEARRVTEEARIAAEQEEAQREAQEAADEKNERLREIQKEIADLNAKYASDVAAVDNNVWATQGVVDREKQVLYQQYIQDYNLLKAEFQQVYYSN